MRGSEIEAMPRVVAMASAETEEMIHHPETKYLLRGCFLVSHLVLT